MRATERETTTALLMYRAVQMGVSVSDLDLLTVGMLLDMATEAANDEYEYPEIADQSDFDAFM